MRIGVLTGGGDCPGLNAVIRAVVRRGEGHLGHNLVGYRYGWRGVMTGDVVDLTVDSTRGILHRGGTILGCSGENPYRADDGVARTLHTLRRDRIDALIVIGGEGTLIAAHRLSEEEGVQVVGVPKTIDNDLSGTDVTFGFHTAVQVACDAVDRLHTTAESHDRVIVLEVMGRHTGWLATYAGMGGGADVILTPEDTIDMEEVCDRLTHRHDRGAGFSIVVVAEGVTEVMGLDQPERPLDEWGMPRLGGIGILVADEVERRTGFETRVTILGHLQRGGTPVAFDRVLATRMGLAAIDAAHAGDFATMVALRGTEILPVPLTEGVEERKYVDRGLLDAAATFFG